jgi:polyisoprenoid-binding protein YceI
MRHALIAASLLLAATAAPVIAQMPTAAPGTKDPSRVEAGTYKVDGNHTQVLWRVDHMGITPLYGAFGEITGTLTIDPAKPTAAKVSITIPMTGMTVTSPAFLKHLSSPDFFDTAKFATATFESTSVTLGKDGDEAKIAGNLTIHGVTKPVVLEAEFYGAGANPMSKKLNIGFKAETTVKRSDFGLGYAVPVVGDEVALKIVAAFEKQ